MEKKKKSKAKTAADHRWNTRNYDRIETWVRKGWKAELLEYVKSRGESMSHFITRAIHTQLEVDSQTAERMTAVPEDDSPETDGNSSDSSTII